MKLKKVTIANLQRHHEEPDFTCQVSECTSCHEGDSEFDGFGDR